MISGTWWMGTGEKFDPESTGGDGTGDVHAGRDEALTRATRQIAIS